MKTSELFDLLEKNNTKTLQFEYSPGRLVRSNFHITEVKHVSIDSVDCGSGTDQWHETIIQLWESPVDIDKEGTMSAFKALGILKKVGNLKSYDPDAQVKFEYGNSSFHTAQLVVHNAEVVGHELIVRLHSDVTDCKAKEACGIEEVQQKVMAETDCCGPGSSCC
ncbi:MAG: hypothetical protein KJN59_01405 [Bacteroidia bacterium]|nr:hypothetical protein [Bacteroidia bacterium]NNF82676.1 hypothetical protein [Flavobacteriaceae bacterium]